MEAANSTQFADRLARHFLGFGLRLRGSLPTLGLVRAGLFCVAIVAARGGVAQPAEPGLAAFCELRPRYQKTQGLTRSDQKASSEKNEHEHEHQD